MTSQFVIGLAEKKPVLVDMFTLADTRGVICASSGAGKSWTLRLIVESVASSIQTIVIDPEGEFATLREKLDLLVVGESGDLRADVRSAGLLARRLAETGLTFVTIGKLMKIGKVKYSGNTNATIAHRYHYLKSLQASQKRGRKS